MKTGPVSGPVFCVKKGIYIKLDKIISYQRLN